MAYKTNPNISVDCVIFGFDFEKLKVLLVERELTDESGNSVFKDLTLTGNHIYEHEDLPEAASRILYDLTGLENIYLEQFKAFGHPKRLSHPKDVRWLKAINRNPANRIVTVAFYSLLNIHDHTLKLSERQVNWYPVDEITELGYDHMEILHSALEALRSKIRTHPIGFELLPKKFTLTQLQKVYETIMGYEYDKRNFRKKIARMKYLIPLDEKQKGVAHKPARLYMFSRDIYEHTKRQFFDFTV